MMTRIFVVEIDREFKDAFERDFSTISIELVSGSKGLMDVEILKPIDHSKTTYSMITRWENQEALSNIFGENWQQPVIPQSMKHYAKSHQVLHFENW